MQKYDLIVVGGGILGTFHAYHAALMGKKVAVIEKDNFPMEATVRNFGQVVPSGFALGRWHHYGRYATQLYQQIQSKFDIGIRNNGSLYVASTPGELQLLHELKTTFDGADYPSTWLSKQEVLEQWPMFKRDYVLGGLFFPQEVSAESRKMIHALQAFLSERYAIAFHFKTPVIEIEDNGREVKVHTVGKKTFLADKVLVCNGRDFKILYPEIFQSAPIEVVKLHMMATVPHPNIKLQGNILTGLTIRRYESFKSLPSYAQLDKNEVNPFAVENGIHILFKQRIDGSIVIGDSHHYADSSNTDDLGFDVDQRVGEVILSEAQKIIHLPDWKLSQSWNGFYAQMNGEEEIFEHSPSENVHIVTAIGGKGMTASAGYALANCQQIFG